jgi:6-phosphogluconolactonase
VVAVRGRIEQFPPEDFAARAARRVAAALPARGTVVLTGGGTAARGYPELAAIPAAWPDIEVYFSDERCVPPDDDDSNYGMVRQTLLEPAGIERVLRMRGEDDPDAAAASYEAAVRPAVERGIDLLLLGLGADAHVAAIFPSSPALGSGRLCVSVDRPDGMRGLTLTPPALLAARTVMFLVTGDGKTEAVRRAVARDEDPARVPARIFAHHPAVTFLVDDPAAAAL